MNTTDCTPQIIDLSFLASKQGKSKADSLADLREEMLCNSKLRDKAGIENLVFGNGNPNADVFFVYEAPGVEEELLITAQKYYKIGATKYDMALFEGYRFNF